ncbi:TonB-dependent receptor [Sphingomonas sp. PL-96]|uniref:TonB-dependent receptor n=1 Tax=Sphingomonas sp. PL-96 TaxID=2887201 RepID=UPI001E32E5D3|nr:TonB-dependent receptor [Sphingomonas sp. PL-96]MCC2977127.1 TonB-dependent receptor [Sphingomonas sp. PL-96]
MLTAIAHLSGQGIMVSSGLVGGRSAPALKGRFDVATALARVLAGTGLRAQRVGDGFVIRTAIDRPPILGQDESTSEEARGVVVTGTRIRGAAPVGANVVTIGRREIEESGRATTQDILAALPQNFGGGPSETTPGFSARNNASANIGYGSGVNLRGLGVTSTLVLVDGNRTALGAGSTFVDLSLIPSSAIDRIEVLPDGASALYGSDAVAGVVNVRLRDTFEGAETRLRYGIADGFDEVQASQLLGTAWQGGRLAGGYEFYRRGRLGADERTYATEDLRAFGGPDYRQAFGNPATLVAADGRVFGVPRGQDGRTLAAGDLIAGTPNLTDGRKGTDLLPYSRRHSAYLALEQRLDADVIFRAKGFFADRLSDARYLPGLTPFTVTPANPFYVDPIGTGQPVSVRYDFRQDLGPFRLRTKVRNVGGTAGLGFSPGRWLVEFGGAYGEQRERQTATNVVNQFRLAQALADPDPRTAFNPFGDGSHTSAATIERIRGGYRQTGTSRVWSVNAKADGPLARLPAGDLRVAIGGEYRRERNGFSLLQDQFTAAPIDGGNAGFPLTRAILAGYGELLVPLASPDQQVPGVRRLDVSLAARVEDYSDFGTTTNPRLGISYEPADGLKLRASLGTSFRAPSFLDIRGGPGLDQVVPFRLADPASPTGSTPVVALFGNDPDIGPEKARTWTVGVEATPAILSGITARATYFDVAYRDRIYNVAVDFQSVLSQRSRFETLILDNPSAEQVAALYANPYFINPNGIDASAIRAIVDARNANLARTTIKGIDFDVGYATGTRDRRLELGLSGAYLFHIRQKLTQTAPASDVAGNIGNATDLKLRARAVASFGSIGAAAFVNHVGGYLNNGVTPVEQVESWTTLDLQVWHMFGADKGALRNMRLSLAATNLLDEAPPYVNNRTPFSASGFDPEQASPVGRVVALQLVKSW